ncbi:FRG domain-containing protein [Pseudoalteromonas sp. SG45-5]|uniref:FRG domain-containing protein n=1 Tax=unclassified Pseudoalteromonas TaxID=194690 RepID=UPI0015FE07FD|nr:MULTISPECIES: FRG domain-containing protein [unclassified Pseudoalteromonas]MBB1385496.1 FRG domain-containing protein [Pseudoalteromonas sp. SG45-5]MBB1393432.1 FRG domain-containing protein [Pseudoalteromonas sp. SG44-4]
MIQEIRVTSFENYVNEITEREKEMWFRGVTNKSFSLIPGSVRYGLGGDKEISAVLDFMAAYQNYHTKIENSFELYSLMQHYGFPTRLLDWSTSMIVALYFALDGEASHDRDGNSIDRVVWGMTTGMLNKLNFLKRRVIPTAIGKASSAGEKYLPSPLRREEGDNSKFEVKPIAVRMPFTNKRVHAQKGCFTIHGSDPQGIEDIMLSNGLGSELVKFVFDENAATNIRKTLHKMEINEDDIYQDLNSLSQRIVRKRKIGVEN